MVSEEQKNTKGKIQDGSKHQKIQMATPDPNVNQVRNPIKFHGWFLLR